MKVEFVICLSLAGAGIITLIVHRMLGARPGKPEGWWDYVAPLNERPERLSEFISPRPKLDYEARRFWKVTTVSMFLGTLFSVAIVLTLMRLFGFAVLT